MRDPNQLPTTGPMATEPARTIAQTFADKVLIKTAVAAIVALASAVLKFTVADDLVENITTIIMFAAIVITPLLANKEQGDLAKKQGEDTRAAVYAPATVARIADQQYEAGLPPVEPQPDVPAPAGDVFIKNLPN